MNKKKIRKQIIAIVLLVVGLVGIVFGVLGIIGGGGRIEPYEARQGIVLVYAAATAYNEDGSIEQMGGTGTGWAVGKPGKPVEYIVTNGHVVEAAYTYPKMYANMTGTVQVYYSAAENDFAQVEVVYYSPQTEKDIAILKLPTPTNKRVPLTLRESDSVKMSETAYALGYPGDSSIRQTLPAYDLDDVTITKGIISNRVNPNWSTYEAFQMDVSIAAGNSGGPLVDEDGRVIGINSSGAVDQETGLMLGMNYSIIIDELTKILDQERISYTMADGLSWVPAWFVYVFLPVGILALAGGILLLLMSMGKVGAVLSSAGGGEPRRAAARGGGPMGKHAALRGVTGKYAGQSFDLLKGKVILGRNPAACNIVFDKNTPGISGQHCQVAYDATKDCFFITDLGSSYGTFLGNGKKLTANVEESMSAGDTFYLCDNANRFVVVKE
ncbi:MAG TPA: trypsin-like peptidase domain-containing protein [Candidatus Choladousia intestinavium]|uniref:Trypsin-like peptidase domain-containing protein n=1 Tax=Candidatus Choladousia intestinavium TaxID=2840727 RepID=A0A9D1AE62_9FIRM|nr:trypsin-like peptidase domain-containing protein [Candidatus Choladousia intestinavium]